MRQAPQLILDTDMDTDCDDAGALAVIHALASRGECVLAGVVCSLPFDECAGAVHSINAAYLRRVPVGLARVPEYYTDERWALYRAHRARFFAAHQDRPYNVRLSARPAEAEEAVSLYRRLLAQAPDQAITICAIGTLTVLAQLLESRSDAHSELDGIALIRAKVRELVTMAAAPHPKGRERFNWQMDRDSAAAILARWPGVMTVSAAGDDVPTGVRFVAMAPSDHPVRIAYTSFLGGEGRDRPSWDLIAALYAVRGLAAPFALSGSHQLRFDPAAADYAWVAHDQSAPPRRYATPTIDSRALAALLEGLMIESLRCD